LTSADRSSPITFSMVSGDRASTSTSTGPTTVASSGKPDPPALGEAGGSGAL
jgi:hypothetical protein